MADWKIPAAAKELGVSASWLYEQAAAGVIDHQRYGPKMVRLTDEQIETVRRQFAQQARPVRSLGRRAS
jgi:hypothetical protein